MFWRNRNFWFDEIENVKNQLPKDFAKLSDVENEASLPEVDVLPESVE